MEKKNIRIWFGKRKAKDGVISKDVLSVVQEIEQKISNKLSKKNTIISFQAQ